VLCVYIVVETGWLNWSQEPERALEVYEQALRRNPKDSQLRAKMGQVLQKEFFRIGFSHSLKERILKKSN
jgi:hypothetical protein